MRGSTQQSIALLACLVSLVLLVQARPPRKDGAKVRHSRSVVTLVSNAREFSFISLVGCRRRKSLDPSAESQEPSKIPSLVFFFNME